MQKAQARLHLKKGKERPLLQNHHWIYSGAVASLEGGSQGGFADVFAHSGEKLGIAMLTPGRSIVGHLLARHEETIEEAITQRLGSAILLRQKLFDPNVTNAYRLINAEGDRLPGLILDMYNGVLVLQISHPSLESIKPFLVDLFQSSLRPKAIYEKSTSFLRKKEGMQEIKQHLAGEELPVVEVLENSLRFSVSLLEGQKTGFFLDQREMRALVFSLAKNRRVLNCFAYTGGFSISALAGGAAHVDSVEISKKCEPFCLKNIQMNHLDSQKHRFLTEDAIDFIAKKDLPYDLVILDPPAFVKKKEDIDTAFRAYKELNRMTIEKLPPNSLLLTSSCSYHVSEELFQNILFRASLEAKRNVRILEKHRQAHDHPVSVYHPEASYLKSFLLWVG